MGLAPIVHNLLADFSREKRHVANRAYIARGKLPPDPGSSGQSQLSLEP